jgi:hypothetical protein
VENLLRKFHHISLPPLICTHTSIDESDRGLSIAVFVFITFVVLIEIEFNKYNLANKYYS